MLSALMLVFFYFPMWIINIWVGCIISPILIFAVFYLIGKKSDLNWEISSIVLALLIGNLASLFIGLIIYSVMLFEIANGIILSIMLDLIVPFFVVYFLVALGGLSMGYIGQKKVTLSAEPEPSPSI